MSRRRGVDRWFGLVVTVVALAAIAVMVAVAEPVAPSVACFTPEVREKVRGIMFDSIDDALHDQIKSLFTIWMKDDRGQPDRASVGMRQALIAYQHSREQAVAWIPPQCKGAL